MVAYIDGRNESYAKDDKPEAMSNDEFDELLSIHGLSDTVN